MSFPLPALIFGGARGDEPGASDGRAPRPSRFRVVGAPRAAEAPPGTPPDDHVMVARLRAGDEAAFRVLWHAHAARLADVAYRYLRSADAAADVVQQTFISVWESRQTLEVHTSLANLLYGAVRNRATNVLAHDRVVRHHRERVAAEYDAAAFAAHNEGPRRVEAQELADAVRAIVSAMPARTREIFLMSREDGLEPAEIASLLGLSPQTVYNQLARAVRMLAEGLSGAA